MLDLWYKNAVIYSLDVETFQDSDGDGIGDFNGLTRRLDYLAGLGVTCLWLLPFYPSPNRDNGYDVMDYYGVDPRLGTLGDFVEFTHQARERGLRILIDLVVNHTSDQHPWFRQACRDPRSKYRDYYIWSQNKPKDMAPELVFPGEQEANWTWDEQAGAWYFHHFYDHQPDLNMSNPAVREEIDRIMGFWLELGVSGFRIDAAPFLIRLRGVGEEGEDGGEPSYQFLHDLREFLSWRRAEAILLAEANIPADTIAQYFGDGDRMHMLFNFILNQHVALALARGEAGPVVRGLGAAPGLPPTGQWANFLRNHDELTLDRLSERERQEVFDRFAPDPAMRIFGRGIRRRLPPMFDGDRHRLELAYSLLLTLPGTPVLRYGEEIGMGDDLSLPGREPVRTVMQWSDAPNAGFSTAPPDRLIRPAIQGGPFGYGRVNVRQQHRKRDSFLQWMEQMIRARRDCPEIGWGECSPVPADQPAVLALRYVWQGKTVILLHNLGGDACEVSLELPAEEAGHLVDILTHRDYAPLDGDARPIRLDGYGYRWFRVDEVQA